MLAALGVARLALLTNNPDKVDQLRSHDLEVEVVPTAVHLSSANARYLAAKARGGHTLLSDVG